MSPPPQLTQALARLRAGKWIVGVSGGLDSVALLVALTHGRPDVTPVVAHLDHEFRGHESDADRAFVERLCERLRVECVVSRLRDWDALREENLEARFREARLAFFAREVRHHNAQGVVLAQHADDRAETILFRLLRGGEPWAIDSLRQDRTIHGVRIVRPLVDVRRSQLERFLVDVGQAWREDSSNQDEAFARNRIRKCLQARPDLVPQLLLLGDASGQWRDWVESNTPALSEAIETNALADLPDPLARHALRQWLGRAGVEGESVQPVHLDRLLQMARDRASPGVTDLPGKWTARRQRGAITLHRRE